VTRHKGGGVVRGKKRKNRNKEKVRIRLIYYCANVE
jgi:hypothetical protein